MEAGIYQRVTADAGVTTALAGGLMYPLVLPETIDHPSLTYQLISSVEDYTLDGPVGNITARLQIDAWAGSYAVVKALAAAVKACLNGFTGVLPDGTAVQNIMLDSASDLYESGAELFRVQQDFMILYAAG